MRFRNNDLKSCCCCYESPVLYNQFVFYQVFFEDEKCLQIDNRICYHQTICYHIIILNVMFVCIAPGSVLNTLIFFPTCLQGSAKLEKAEILQMTVDHLKYLHAKGKHGKKTTPLISIKQFISKFPINLKTPVNKVIH